MYAIVDIETTGGEYNQEGVTEIAIYKFDGIKVVDQFISLVNPLKEIQPFVVKLTGINSKMLCNAPKFHEIAKRIVEITKDCILVAHNASFDYRVLKKEFSRLGFNYERQTICTVKLSKILLPDQPSYKLGNLIRSLGIPFSDQHRAHGDAKVTLKLFEILLEKDVKKTIVNKNIERLNFDIKNSNYFFASFLGFIPHFFIWNAVGSGINNFIRGSDSFNFTNLIMNKEIYIPILIFLILVSISLIRRSLSSTTSNCGLVR